MVTLFRKLFVKNYQNVDDPKVRVGHGKLAAAFGVVSNIILFGIKLLIGLISKSVSIIADSINNLSDFANSTITLVGFKISSKPADKKHPFGHQRIEYITGLIVSIVVVALAILLLYNSIDRIINPVALASKQILLWSIIILAVSVFLKLLQGYFNLRISKIINSVALKATAVDSFTDSIATFLLFVSALLSYFLGWNLDGYMGIAVALFVGYAGIKMVVETSSPLIGESTSMEEVKKVVDEILSYKEVLGVHDLVAHNYGPSCIFMTIHCEVDSRIPITQSHDVIDNIEANIRKNHNVMLTIHMDPIDVSNPEVNRLREKVGKIVKELNSELTFHDFRVVFGNTHINILFDVVLPFDLKISEAEILNIIKIKVNEGENIEINPVINFDRPFVEEENDK